VKHLLHESCHSLVPRDFSVDLGKLDFYSHFQVPLALWKPTSSSSSNVPFCFFNSLFKSKFHCFDAAVIVAGFITDVLLHGVLEEVASLVVILRLWRFFKIIEEFSVGAEEQMDGLELRIEQLETENEDLKRELKKQKGTLDDEEEVGFQSARGTWK